MKSFCFALMLMTLVLARLAAGKEPTCHLNSSTVPDAPARIEAPVAKEEGIVKIPSNHSVDETVARLQKILQVKGVTIFALVDHSGEAAKVGMTMLPTKLLIFGSPKGGTPLMIAAPSLAIDLPLRILVSQDTQGNVWLSYNSPQYLMERHGFPQELLENIAVVSALAEQAGQ